MEQDVKRKNKNKEFTKKKNKTTTKNGV